MVKGRDMIYKLYIRSNDHFCFSKTHQTDLDRWGEIDDIV